MDTSKNIVMNAEELRLRKKPPIPEGPAYFRATAGHYQEEFVSIHRLFEIPDASEIVVSELADAAMKLKIQFGFNAILACTVTAKMLMERLHAQLESTPDELKTFYLGNFPFVNPESQGLIDLSGRRVLILTDVIASGTTVRKLCTTVKQCHGEALAILAAVLTEPDLSDPKPDGCGEMNGVRLRYLSHYPIVRIKPNKLPAKFYEIEIDPLTVMPKTEPNAVNGYHAAVSTSDAITHFERSKSLRTGFFQRDGRRMTAAIRFEKLLDYRDVNDLSPTWQQMSPLIEEVHKVSKSEETDGSPWILATTLNENDIRSSFKTYATSEQSC